jgi:LysM repeat protein
MKSQGLRGIGNALTVALISIGLMVGALSISLVEFVPQVTPTAASDNPIPSPIPLTATNTPIPTLTPTLGLKSPTPSNTPTSTITSTPPASCLPPVGWGQMVIQADDTLDSIALRYRVSTVELRLANCLLSDSLMAGTVLYAPSVETSTPFMATNTPLVTTNTPSAICNPGATGWVKNYKVKAGDTFYAIAFNYYTTQTQLKSVNCYTSDFLSVGEILWVPNSAPRTSTQRPTSIPSVTATIYLTKPFTETTLPFTITVLPYTVTVFPSNTPDPASISSMQTVTAIPTP